MHPRGLPPYIDNATDASGHRIEVAVNEFEGEKMIFVDELGFANGVAFGPDEAYLLINETMRYRITRSWLSGEKSGQTDIFIENLPGFPDNLSYNDEGLFGNIL